jgi:hypothetical protein
MVMLIHALKFHSMPAEHAGNREILVVAFRLSSTWLARMATVAGRGEWPRVIQSGRTVREPLARQLFPEFREVAYEVTPKSREDT